MATKKSTSSVKSRRSTSRGKNMKVVTRKGKYLAVFAVGAIVLISIIGVYTSRQPVDALAMGCSSGYSASILPQDADWNADPNTVITQTMSEPTYDRETRSCAWQETVTAVSSKGVERKSCMISTEGQQVACPEAGQTITVFSGTRTGDPNQIPYLPLKLHVEEVLSNDISYTTTTLNY